jgi:AcrR family transcriptional regulator
MKEKAVKNKAYSAIDQVVFAEIFPNLKLNKGKQRAYAILLAAIQCYRERGIENTTYQDIAKKNKVSRALIFQYFKDYDDIFYHAIKLVRVRFQQHAVDAMKLKTSPTEKLRSYIQSVFSWIDKHPAFASTLLLYFHRCSSKAYDRDLNTQFTEVGQMRIAALIRAGIQTNEFKCDDPDGTAHLIQTQITGASLTRLTVNLSSPESYEKIILDHCLGLVGVKSK